MRWMIIMLCAVLYLAPAQTISAQSPGAGDCAICGPVFDFEGTYLGQSCVHSPVGYFYCHSDPGLLECEVRNPGCTQALTDFTASELQVVSCQSVSSSELPAQQTSVALEYFHHFLIPDPFAVKRG